MLKTVITFIVAAIAIFVPAIIFGSWRRKTNCTQKAYIVGLACFLMFAYLLETLFTLVIFSNETTYAFVTAGPIRYALYGGLVAGLFEETGRLFGFKLLLKKSKTKETAIGYGIGHAGMECALTLGITYILYFFASIGVGGYSLSQYAQALNSLNLAMIPIALLERAAAFLFHIALSILVFKAANNSKSFYLYPVAILLHLIVDVPAALYQYGAISSVFVVEAITTIFAIAIFYIALRIYKKMK